MGTRLNVSFKGFEEYVQRLEQAHGDVDAAFLAAAQESASVVQSELEKKCAESGVPSSVSGGVGREVKANNNIYDVKVGWPLGSYNPRSLSQGFKALFLNYGTVRRTVSEQLRVQLGGEFKTLGRDRGQITPRGFIEAAKKSSNAKVKKAQRAAFEQIIKEAQG